MDILTYQQYLSDQDVPEVMRELDPLQTNEILPFNASSRQAFGGFTKRRIKDRARDELGYVGSELSGRRDRPLEASHINHRRGRDYDTPENGQLLTDYEHLAYHLMYRNNAREIGLSEDHNEDAIWSIIKRIKETNSHINGAMTNQEIFNIAREIISTFFSIYAEA